MRKIALMGVLAFALAGCGSASEAPAADEGEAAAGQSEDTAASQTADTDTAAPQEVLRPGTEYSATTIMDCGFDNKPPTQSCNAGVKRNWGEDGTALVEVFKPDGSKRAIFVRGTEPYGADSAQADGSAGWEFNTTRDGDRVTVKFGPETYVIVDALITGG